MRLCEFEDGRVSALEPLSLTRPVFDLLCGTTTIYEKHRRAFRPGPMGALVRPHLSRVTSADHPHLTVNVSDWLLTGSVTFVNSRWLPPRKFVPPANSEMSCVAMIGDEIAYAVLQPRDLAECTPHTLENCLTEWKSILPRRPAGGRLINRPWDLIEFNPEELQIDFLLTPHDDLEGRPSTLTLVGSSDLLRVDPTARIDPFVVADTTNGPVIIGRDAVVASFTRLEGPCFIGPRSEVFHGNIRAGTSIGPNCRVGGEVNSSILLANSNKAHEGYLGHSYLGEWVKLGAGTHASDLRNDHAPIAVPMSGTMVCSDLQRVGVFIGDHAKSGVGCRLNAGSNIGPFAQLLPSGSLLPKLVPAFCSVEHGRLMDCPDPSLLFAAAARVTARRGDEFTEYHQAMYSSLFDRTSYLRKLAVHEAELRRLRRAG